MTRDEFDQFCQSLPATTHAVQWGGASVWKVGDKIFAIAPLYEEADYQRISFKCPDITYDILCELPGIIPAPYLARAKWVQVLEAGALSDVEIRDYITLAHETVAAKLTKKVRAELGL